ncbi:MAG: signal recognition particle-docking protein FtsY [Candidatus Raymondbacteria bacterium RifOxyA12_full_50_37]|uniref:Signal recognition particle receptor FtsY n=1 Tax=Candidatus Raymondbacteria bacterium RIFOXYD12_FULL_49_13 TaxID=1817890 RepID=A0A1F7F4D7_UNCRA|nr:MAG: signal recognition particle-docking protein FtsY [Candidatus Raymondbacteria bacterium RifOxyA12_full_50_37]OGJ93842.1 MAG: signal recognition particle-docking protein FtsY [Candidatus Raymondbacteria bacterium RIFOXYA2_FULL_49_16]OGJ97322.1 MAG: signal recognition particle-docking protein FtsY [Candidatus Raymondbacteria bacterium RifOxyC12_full_50_8]OGJ98291.1 MAG: signal recognition particle-docking protein FtsY [Candidatus Raymondbacteria bacterium RIFOXYC2_FULL_50_21]OGK01407.1 MAG
MALLDGLQKTRTSFFSKFKALITFRKRIDDNLLDKIEEALITSDVGVEIAVQLIERLKALVAENRLVESDAILEALKNEMAALFPALQEKEGFLPENGRVPGVLLVVGVNGSGKTTTIGKLARYFIRERGKKVLLAACDTFRAAAIEQLTVWAERTGCELIKGVPGGDPAAVAFDALVAAINRGHDLLIIDTAGRLHTKVNLMEELRKIRQVLLKKRPDLFVHTLLVLDGTTGQNALMQAREFNGVSDVSGLVVTKLDGTAKGGIVFSICKDLSIPVDFIGTGEGPDDLVPFSLPAFIESFFKKEGLTI